MFSSARDTPHSSMHLASSSLTGIGCGTGYLEGGWLENWSGGGGEKGQNIVTRYPRMNDAGTSQWIEDAKTSYLLISASQPLGRY